MQEKVWKWLRGIPGLENLTSERLGELPGCAGLFYQGAQVVSRTADILGNEFLRRRLRWKLIIHGNMPVEIAPATAPQLGLLQTVELAKTHVSYLDEMEILRWETELTVEFTEVRANTEVADAKL